MRLLQFMSVALFAGFMATGCAGVAHIEKDDTANFTSYKTFAWVETLEGKEEVNKSVSDITEKNIKSAVSAELSKQGWKETKHKPDVFLSYDVLVEKSVKESSNPVYRQPYTRYLFNPYTRRWVAVYYPSRFMGYDNNVYEVREGTVTISMIDAQTDKTVWQGWTTNEVNNRNLTSKEIQNSVKSIFRKFDVAKN